uniref:Uncharacterized protein n=1 Tax=Solanum lycopersicum TaxID=4081 RepID=A0A3Q7H7K2_SOLLC
MKNLHSFILTKVFITPEFEASLITHMIFSSLFSNPVANSLNIWYSMSILKTQSIKEL